MTGAMATPLAASDGRRLSWTGVDLIARLGAVMGVIALGSGIIHIATTLTAAPGAVHSQVFQNARRMPHVATLEYLAVSQTTNLLIVLGWYLFLVSSTVLFLALVLAVYRRAPALAASAGVFFGGAAVAGVLIGSAILKVGEFTVQYTGATAAEQAWVSAGINFLHQLHLFYVSAWFFSLALGSLFLGLTVGSAERRVSMAGRLLTGGGLVLIASVIGRGWLPSFGVDAPRVVVAMGEPLASAAIGLTLIGSALLWRAVGPTAGD
jgi:hypothetical protein